MGVFRCFVSLYGVIESDLAVFHSLGMIAFTVVLGSGAMCLGRIVMMPGGFKVCIFWHIHSPCPRTRTHQLMIPVGFRDELHARAERVADCSDFDAAVRIANLVSGLLGVEVVRT